MWSLNVFPAACIDFPKVLELPHIVQRRDFTLGALGASKLAVGAVVSMKCCLSLYISDDGLVIASPMAVGSAPALLRTLNWICSSEKRSLKMEMRRKKNTYSVLINHTLKKVTTA